MNKKTYLKKAEELWDSIVPIQNEIREKSEKYLQMALKENDGSINFDDYETDESVSVSYDGGNHPEYASNCFSIVNAVYLKDGIIYLDTEDCSEYPISDINWDEVFDVAMFIQQKILNKC
jgi:hypothetical protein